MKDTGKTREQPSNKPAEKERGQMEEMLRESEEWYHDLFENANDLIQSVTPDGHFVQVNRAWRETLGYTQEEISSLSLLDIIHPDSRAYCMEVFQRVISGESVDRIEAAFVTKDGKKIIVEGSANCKFKYGKPVTTRGIFRDITESKQAEAERLEMERRVQVTDRLASIGEMASGIAHEINNPLTSVVGFSELLMTKDLPEDLRKDVEIIHDGAKRVAGIVKRLLTFARQHKPERTYTDINEIIESTLILRKYSLETGNIEVSTSLEPELPWTMADTGQLQQVFMNIIVNAETEMKQAHGRGKFTIKTEQIGNTIRLSFKDDGPGIAKDNIGKVFDPFFTTKKVGEGTGLGLSLSHGIIIEHNGRIYAESKTGRGAIFIIELPVVAKEEEKIETVDAAEEAGRALGARILVVDDEPTILTFLKKVLVSEGYDVATASSGEEALGMIKNERYSLILLDIKLPGLSGDRGCDWCRYRSVP